MTQTRYPRERSDNHTVVATHADRGSWSVVTAIAERDGMKKIDVLREALRMLCRERHPDLVDLLTAPDGSHRELVALRAEVERLRAQLNGMGA